MKNNLKKISDALSAYNMFDKNDRILVAFSGGCDSVCLALALCNLGYKIGLAHVNHNLRETASRDEAFCRDFAKKLNIPIHIACPDVKGYAEMNKISLETAGRILRYEFFEQLTEYNKIATAHHKNDCAETVLQHLVRGSGLKGLTGILPVRDGKFVRPLIGITRKEVEDIVSSYNESFCTDETNFSDEYSRNRIRLNVIPLLEQENERAVDNICKTASLLKSDEEFLTHLAKEHIKNNKISVDVLKGLPSPLAYRVLRQLFENAAGTSKDFEARHIEYILSHLKEHGDILDLPFNVTASSQYGEIVFYKKSTYTDFCEELLMGENVFPELNLKITLNISDKKPKKGTYLDNKKLGCNKLYARFPKESDYFVPLGSDGGKNLSKVLIDMKIPRIKRPSTVLIASSEEIISIAFKKRSFAYSCDENTKEFLIILEENIHE